MSDRLRSGRDPLRLPAEIAPAANGVPLAYMQMPDTRQLWFTYGPQTTSDATVRSLLQRGATGARLTFSYGTPALQCERARQIRRIATEVGITPYLVADLQGEKPRLGKIDGTQEISVSRRQIITLTDRAIDLSPSHLKLPVQVATHLNFMTPGDVIVEGDGALLLAVLRKSTIGVECEALGDGTLHPGRGLAIRSAALRLASLTRKDLDDLRVVTTSELFDAVALSFVADGEDVRRARASIPSSTKLAIIAKIETQSGIQQVLSIGQEADMLMAARGDLALFMPWEDLPAAVEAIAAAARRLSKPWILATQVVEGMERFVFPTRAEICDLAHWITEGAFGVMLSYETAFGPRPSDAIGAARTIMDRYTRTREVFDASTA